MRVNKYHIQVLIVEFVAVVLAGFVILIVTWARTLSQPRRAQAFLQDIAKLEVGKSTFDEAKSVTQKYGGIPWWVTEDSMRCTYQRCVFRFVFENKPLTSTYVVPYTGLIGMVAIKDGTVVGLSLNYFRNTEKSRPFAYNVLETSLPIDVAIEVRRKAGLSRMNVDLKGTPSAVTVYLDGSSSPDQRRRAYALDLSCLSKFFGCNKPSAIFPRDIPYQGPPYQTHLETW